MHEVNTDFDPKRYTYILDKNVYSGQDRVKQTNSLRSGTSHLCHPHVIGQYCLLFRQHMESDIHFDRESFAAGCGPLYTHLDLLIETIECLNL